MLWCALVCRAVLRCALLCCAALFRAVLRCALLCNALQCRAVICHAVLWRLAPSRAVPCRAVPCCALSRDAVLLCAVLCCAVLWCAVLWCVASCCAVLCCAVLCPGSVAPPGLVWGGGSEGQNRGFAVCVMGAPCGLGLCGWSVVGGRGLAWYGLLGRCCVGSGCAVQSDASGGCPWGCPLLGPAPFSRALWGSLSLGVYRGLRGASARPSCFGLFPSLAVSPRPCRPPSLVLCPCPFFSLAARVLVSVCLLLLWRMVGVVAWL